MNTPLTVENIQNQESVHYKAARSRLRTILRHQNQYDWLDQHEFGNLSISQAWLATQKSEEAAHLLIAFVETLASYFPPRGLHAELLRWCDDALQACERVQRNPSTLLLIRGEAQYA